MAFWLAFNCHGCLVGLFCWLWALLVLVFPEWLESLEEFVMEKTCIFAGYCAHVLWKLALWEGTVQFSVADVVRAGHGLFFILHQGWDVLGHPFICTLFLELCQWKVYCFSLNSLSFWRVWWGQDKFPSWVARGAQMTWRSLYSALAIQCTISTQGVLLTFVPAFALLPCWRMCWVSLALGCHGGCTSGPGHSRQTLWWANEKCRQSSQEIFFCCIFS